MSNTPAAVKSIREAADRLREQTGSTEWLTSVRDKGLAAFLACGFPAAREEHWKYTRLASLARKAFDPQPQVAPGLGELPERAFGSLDGQRMVFVDGQFSAALSDPGREPGIRVSSLAQAISENEELVRAHLGRIVDAQAHRFASLSDALLADGALIAIPPGTTPARPIYLLFVTTAGDKPVLSNPRILLHMGENATATVIEHHIGLAGSRSLSNLIAEVSLQPGANLDYYQLQETGAQAYHLGGLHAEQHRDSRLVTHSISLGGRMVRNDLHARMVGSGAGIEMYGLYLAGDRQHVDNHTHVEHVAQRTRSHQDYKGVLYGRGRAVFNGKARIHEGATGTEAHQSNHNLLLSENAEIDTKPELEIYNDDVKCSHGATVGQLDKQALFYLRSRGIAEDTARTMLTFAFAEAVLQRIGLEVVRERIESTVIEMLPQSESIREFV